MKGDIPAAAIRLKEVSGKVLTHRNARLKEFRKGWQSLPREAYNARWIKNP